MLHIRAQYLDTVQPADKDMYIQASCEQAYVTTSYTDTDYGNDIVGTCKAPAEIRIEQHTGAMWVEMGNQSKRFGAEFRIPSHVLAQMLAAQLKWEARS